MTQVELATALQVSQPAVSYFERWPNAQVPRDPEILLRIYRLTQGAVTPNDFYHLPDLDQMDLPIDDAAPCPLLERAG